VPLRDFAPFRVRPGDALASVEAHAAATGASPLVVNAGDPATAELAPRSFARISAGRAAVQSDACRAADGRVAGGPGYERGCLHSDGHRQRVAGDALAALAAGHAGVLLDHPDAALGLGLFGAGFSDACQGAFLRDLQDQYGEQLEPFDFRSVAREALAVASGAVSLQRLHFGRDFWRFRHDSLLQGVSAFVRPVRDGARTGGRAFPVTARFDSAGPAQLQAARMLDAAVFPLRPLPHHLGAAAVRVWRAATGQRPVAAELPESIPAPAVARLAAALASAGVQVAFEEGERAAAVAPARRLLQEHLARRQGGAFADPVVEVAVLYSPDSDLWTGGLHRLAAEEAGEALSELHVQWDAVLFPAALRPATVLLVPQGVALSPVEAAAVKRFVEGGGALLAFGVPRQADPTGRLLDPFLPELKEGKATPVGEGRVLLLPPLVADPSAGLPPGPQSLRVVERALGVLRPLRAAVEVRSRVPLHITVWRSPRRLDVHLVAREDRPVDDPALTLAGAIAGTARRAIFRVAGGAEERLSVRPGQDSLSVGLPPFSGYGILSLVP
jgi:hypothetical protein